MDGRHETWVERQIREAQERGEFDNLPGAGKPLRSMERAQEDDWWIRSKIEREQLDMSAALPPQLALRKEAQTLAEAIRDEPSEQAVRERLEDFNARVRECWRRPIDGPIVAVGTVDVEAMLATWRAERAERAERAAAAWSGPAERSGAAGHPAAGRETAVEAMAWPKRVLRRLGRREQSR